MLYNNVTDILRVVVFGICAYVALIILLRISGKRTLSKMNAFDLVVTVALGSTFATILLSKSVSLLEGIAAFATLIVMQFVIAWLSVRSTLVRRLVKSEPSLLYFRGDYLYERMSAERVVEDEICSAVRAQGIALMDTVEAVVLETDGTFTVLPSTQADATSLQNVTGYKSQISSK